MSLRHPVASLLYWYRETRLPTLAQQIKSLVSSVRGEGFEVVYWYRLASLRYWH